MENQVILQKHRKMENIYNFLKKVECYHLKRKKQIQEQNVTRKAFELSGNRNLGEITALGMEMSTVTT